MVVGDLIEVPEIKTVIQLKDIEKLELRQMILNSFIVTAEVRQNLEKIFSSLIKPAGSGAFLKGHFGSGKSHFLSMLSLLLRYPPAWQVILEQNSSLKNFQELLAPQKLLVTEISLVQHRATEFLEDILAQWAEVEVSLPAKEGLEKFLGALAREPFLGAKLNRLEKIKELLQRFHNFRENYIQAYAEAHRRNCSGEQFAPYERVRQSRRYQVLSKLAQIEIVSVLHHRKAIDRSLFDILSGNAQYSP